MRMFCFSFSGFITGLLIQNKGIGEGGKSPRRGWNRSCGSGDADLWDLLTVLLYLGYFRCTNNL